MSNNYTKGAINGFIIGDILGNATNGMTKTDIHNTYYSFGFGLDKSFRPCNIPIDTKRTPYGPGELSDITENFLISIKSVINNGNYSLIQLKEEYMIWSIISSKKLHINKELLCNIAQLMVCSLINTRDYKTILCADIYFNCLLINKVINMDRKQNIDTVITDTIEEMENIYTQNEINMLKQYINYTTYDEIENDILNTVVFCIVALKKVAVSENKTDVFMEIVMEAVREGGNAHINCALVGMICGAYIGYDKLPEDILNNIQYKQKLDTLVNLFLSKTYQ